MNYFSVVSRVAVRITLTITSLNDLGVFACNIQNTYLTADCRDWVWVVAGPKFGPEDGNKMLLRKAIYGLESSGAAFSAFLAKTLNTMVYCLIYANLDLWLLPAVKPDGFEYYEYILCYVVEVLCISPNPRK